MINFSILHNPDIALVNSFDVDGIMVAVLFNTKDEIHSFCDNIKSSVNISAYLVASSDEDELAQYLAEYAIHGYSDKKFVYSVGRHNNITYNIAHSETTEL